MAVVVLIETGSGFVEDENEEQLRLIVGRSDFLVFDFDDVITFDDAIFFANSILKISVSILISNKKILSFLLLLSLFTLIIHCYSFVGFGGIL